MSSRRRQHSKADTLAALLRLKAATGAPGYSDHDDAHSASTSEYNGSMDVNAMASISVSASEETASNSNSHTATDASELSSPNVQTPLVGSTAAAAPKGYMNISAEQSARSNDGALRATYVRELLLGSLSL